MPKDKVQLRGSFKGMNRVVTAVKSYDGDRDGIVFLPICDEVNDKNREGIDATDGMTAVDEGNYGILYKIKLSVAEKKRAKIFLVPIGGAYSGAVKVFAGRKKGEVVMTPKNGEFMGENDMPEDVAERVGSYGGDEYLLTKYHDMTLIGSYKGKDVLIEYSPPGASCLPALLVIMPG